MSESDNETPPIMTMRPTIDFTELAQYITDEQLVEFVTALSRRKLVIALNASGALGAITLKVPTEGTGP